MSALLEVTDLKKHFPIYRGVFSKVSGHVYAVDGVSFSIAKGETLGLVGESGCGKASDRCREAAPPLEEHRPGHFIACWNAA